MSRNCLNCPVQMVPCDDDTADHPYNFDGKGAVRLIGLKRHRCRMCGHSEIDIPKIGPLHRAIAQAIKTLRVERSQLGFLFETGLVGVSDGEWGATISSVPR